MNFVSYFVAPWFIKVLFLFTLFTLPIKDYEIASLPLHYIQGFGSQMTVKGLAMTVKEGSRW